MIKQSTGMLQVAMARREPLYARLGRKQGMDSRRILIASLSLTLLAATALAGCMGNAPENVVGDERVRAGSPHVLEESNTLGDVDAVSVRYEAENNGDAPVTLTVRLTDPSGAELVAENRTLAAGESAEWTVRHDFPQDDGPDGTYRATLEVSEGEVELHDAELKTDA